MSDLLYYAMVNKIAGKLHYSFVVPASSLKLAVAAFDAVYPGVTNSFYSLPFQGLQAYTKIGNRLKKHSYFSKSFVLASLK